GQAEAEFARLKAGARQAHALGIEVHAGHGLDYATSETIAAVPEIVELNTGHFIVGEAVFEGLAAVITSMRAAMDRGRARVARP
ncbi:MAG: pyridoxine 5'-phosphate synthase, partial [Methylacidiphilales bacterium]|nr:pyridoxine 5'-phosphate synthase [Candidatus Methylacidiphilales bacterium]